MPPFTVRTVPAQCKPRVPRLVAPRSRPVTHSLQRLYSSLQAITNAYLGLGRFFTGITNFNPDQTSLTAQTLISTRPASSPLCRIKSSVRSVVTPDAFFGHEIHNMPAGASAFAAGNNSSSSPARDLTNRKTKSRPPSASFTFVHFPSEARSPAVTSSGTCNNATRNESLIPSFFGSGVPEYPAISIGTEDCVTQVQLV